MTPVATSKPALPRMQDPSPRADGPAAVQPFAGLLTPAAPQGEAGTPPQLADAEPAAPGMGPRVLRTFLDIRLQADAVTAPSALPAQVTLPEGEASRFEDASTQVPDIASPGDRLLQPGLLRPVTVRADAGFLPPLTPLNARPARFIPLRAAQAADPAGIRQARASFSPGSAPDSPPATGPVQSARPGPPARASSPLQVTIQASQLGMDVVVRLGAAGAEERARLEDDIAALLAAYGLRISSIDISAPQAVSNQGKTA